MDAAAKLAEMMKSNEQMTDVVKQHEAKKQKIDGGGKPYFETLANTLYGVQKDIRKNYKDEDMGFMEIEVRIGMVIENYRRWKYRCSTKSVAIVDPRKHSHMRFKAGVDHIFARKLKSKLAERMFRPSPQPLQIMRMNEHDQRWTVDSRGTFLSAETKQALEQTNLALLAHEYDIRINVATEKPIVIAGEGGVNPEEAAMQINSIVDYDNWLVERRKKRTSYTCVETPMWRVDYTEVDCLYGSAGINDSSTSNNKTVKEVELEFELEKQPTVVWLQERDEEKIRQTTRQMTEQLMKLVDYCIPYETGTEKEASLLAVHDANFDYKISCITTELQSKEPPRVADITRARSKGAPAFDFLGSMPVNLSRQNLLDVQQSDYFITEKSDGVRYLMYVIPDPYAPQQAPSNVAVLVDRAKSVYKFRGSEILGNALDAGTILDGELVFNRSHRENVFLIFDVLRWKDRSLIEDVFAQRIALLRSDILPAYEKYLETTRGNGASGGGGGGGGGSVNLPGTPPPLRLVSKAFVSRRDLRVLLNKMRLEEGERVFYDPYPGQLLAKRHHKSDGLIFQPNRRYVFSKHYELLKWKWAELRSVDLQVQVANEDMMAPTSSSSDSSGGGMNDSIYLLCGGPDGALINCTKRGGTNVGLGPFDAFRLMADKEDPEVVAKLNGRPAVVEVAYDIQVGQWAYLHLRRDKDQPNFIDSVMGVFMEQAESISIEELEYSLNASVHALENDYEEQMRKMKAKLLDWQRTEVKKRQSCSSSNKK